MRRKTSHVPQAVARHLLGQTPVSPALGTDGASVAGHHCRDDDLLSEHISLPRDDGPADLVAQGQWRLGDRGNAIVEISQVRVTDPTASDLDQDLTLLELRNGNTGLLEPAFGNLSRLPVLCPGLDHLPRVDLFWYVDHCSPPFSPLIVPFFSPHVTDTSPRLTHNPRLHTGADPLCSWTHPMRGRRKLGQCPRVPRTC